MIQEVRIARVSDERLKDIADRYTAAAMCDKSWVEVALALRELVQARDKLRKANIE